MARVKDRDIKHGFCEVGNTNGQKVPTNTNIRRDS